MRLGYHFLKEMPEVYIERATVARSAGLVSLPTTLLGSQRLRWRRCHITTPRVCHLPDSPEPYVRVAFPIRSGCRPSIAPATAAAVKCSTGSENHPQRFGGQYRGQLPLAATGGP
jgi:hypothetical protein